MSKFIVEWNARSPELSRASDYYPFLQLSAKELAERLESKLVIDPQTYQRFSKIINMQEAVVAVDSFCRAKNITQIDQQIDEFRHILNSINLRYYQAYDSDRIVIMKNIRNRAMFLRLEPHGPKLASITRNLPIVDTYFTRLATNDKTKNLHADEKVLANNGWIWNADPLINFAANNSRAYFLREVIAWGDCVKLRYGSGPEDNPWLWEHQTDYTIKMAQLFHGFRIDNCHSTPIHVAAGLLDVARKINPDLYIFAELFTGSEAKDILFVSKLGINSLIREAMNAWDTPELSRIAHRQGGTPVGSFTLPSNRYPLDILGHNVGSDYHSIESKSEFVVNVKSSVPHSLLMDWYLRLK